METSMGYIAFLADAMIVYAAVIGGMKYIRSKRLANFLFMAVTYASYVSLSLIVYSDVGLYDWNFQNTLPMANVSPFMFSLMPILPLLPERAKKPLYLLVSLLSVGMLLSAVFNCIRNAAIGYAFHFHFTLDYLAHFALSLFGVYLVRSGQVEVRARRAVSSGALLFGVAFVMIVLNLILDTSFFGLSLRGKHNIYNNVLVSSSCLSAFIYFVGLFVVLLLGYLFMLLIKRRFAEE